MNEQDFIKRLAQQITSSLQTTPAHQLKPFSGQQDSTSSSFGASHCKAWLDDFDEFAATTELDEETKCRKFPLFLVGPAKEWYRLYVRDDRFLRNDWDGMKKALINFFLPTSYLDFALEALESRMQQPQEPVNVYVIIMQRLCQEVDMEMKEDKIVHYIQRKLLSSIKKDVTLRDSKTISKLLEVARKSEYSQGICFPRNKPFVVSQPGNEMDDLRMQVTRLNVGMNHMMKERSGQMQSSTEVKALPSSGIQEGSQADSRNFYCEFCGKNGHFISYCWSKKKLERDSQGNESTSTDQTRKAVICSTVSEINEDSKGKTSFVCALPSTAYEKNPGFGYVSAGKD